MKDTVSTSEAYAELNPQQDQDLNEKTQSQLTDGDTTQEKMQIEQQNYSKDTSTNTKKKNKNELRKTNDWKNRKRDSKTTFTRSMSLLEKLDKMPPFLCRLLAVSYTHLTLPTKA